MNFSMEKTPVQVLDRSAVLSVASLELTVSQWVAGDPADMGNADDVAVQVSLENTGAARWAAFYFI